MAGEVVAIYISDKKGSPRRLIQEGVFIESYGLKGDVHSTHSDRQVALFTAEGRSCIKDSSVKGLCTERFYENLTINFFHESKLSIGSRINIGESIHEVTQVGKTCFPECDIVKREEMCALSKEVVFTKVIRGGIVRIGDKIII